MPVCPCSAALKLLQPAAIHSKQTCKTLQYSEYSRCCNEFGDMGVSQSLGTLRPHSLMGHRDCKESVGFSEKDSILQGGRWEVGGGKWEDRRKWLRTDSKGRCRSHRFGHGRKAPFEKPTCITVYDKRLFELFRSICSPEEFLIKGLAAYAKKPLRLCKTLTPPNSNGDATQLL